MKKFTEVYFDDALRLAQFLAERFNEEIKPVEMDSEGFPMPAKGEELNERTPALIVGDYAIAFIRKRTGADEDRKHRDRGLHRVQFGFMLKEAREKAGMTLEDVSELTDLKPRNIENIEKGRYDATIDIVSNIAAALGGTFAFVTYDK